MEQRVSSYIMCLAAACTQLGSLSCAALESSFHLAVVMETDAWDSGVVSKAWVKKKHA